MSFLVNTVSKVMRKAFSHFSEKVGVKPEQIQILISASDDEGTPEYQLMQDFKPVRKVKFSEILDVKLDLMNREALATPYLKESLLKFAKELDCPVTEVNVMIYNKEDCEPILCLYKAKQEIRQLEWEGDIF